MEKKNVSDVSVSSVGVEFKNRGTVSKQHVDEKWKEVEH